MNKPELNIPKTLQPQQDQPRKIYTQQVFHKSLLDARPRSHSCSELTKDRHVDNVATDSQVLLTESQQVPPPWQRVPGTKKRKYCFSPPSNETQHENRFGSLPVDSSDDSQTQSQIPKAPIKPPPIILYGIEDVNELSNLITTVVDKQSFAYKIINGNLLRVTIDSTENYKKVIALIRQRGLIGHTFTRKDSKCHRIVIRNLHHTTTHEAIIEEIEKTGNKVVGEIINSRFGPEKKPTTTFFVNVTPCEKNKALKDIRHIYHQQVKIEEPRKTKTIVQCQRCQQYGHSKNNCMRPYRCVKCGDGHKTSACLKKDRNTPAKCALCSLDHPANYKGCQVYKDILSRKTATKSRLSLIAQHQKTVISPNHINPTVPNIETNKFASKTSKLTNDNRTYADVTKTNDNTQQYSTIEQIIIKQGEKIDLLIQQIGTLMNLLTSVVSMLQPSRP